MEMSSGADRGTQGQGDNDLLRLYSDHTTRVQQRAARRLTGQAGKGEFSPVTPVSSGYQYNEKDRELQLPVQFTDLIRTTDDRENPSCSTRRWTARHPWGERGSSRG